MGPKRWNFFSFFSIENITNWNTNESNEKQWKERAHYGEFNAISSSGIAYQSPIDTSNKPIKSHEKQRKISSFCKSSDPLEELRKVLTRARTWAAMRTTARSGIASRIHGPVAGCCSFAIVGGSRAFAVHVT